MSTNTAMRMPTWRNLVWVGVVASVVAWAWAWYVDRGGQAVMLLFALATVVLAYKAVAGMRLAVAGLMIAAFAMFLASVYWMFWVMLPAGPTNAFDMASVSLFPMVASVILFVGAAAGFRHVREGMPQETSAQS